jgi:DNA-binding Xre family transcriptional regulator
MHIGKSIKVALAKKGMKSKDLAKILGVTGPTVSTMTTRATASGQMLNRLAEAFDMPVSDFVSLGED